VVFPVAGANCQVENRRHIVDETATVIRKILLMVVANAVIVIEVPNGGVKVNGDVLLLVAGVKIVAISVSEDSLNSRY